MTGRCPSPEIHLLGEIIVGFGDLELALEMAIWKLLGDQDAERLLMAQAITAEMSFDRKVHALASMVRGKYGDTHQAALAGLVKALFEAQDQRNGLLHSAWSYSPQFETVVRMKSTAKASRGLKRTIDRMNPERLEGIRNRIRAVVQALERFTATHLKEASERAG
jgi:hypothetical protein